ncbi:glycogen synthase [Spirochaeta africana]|nr:glycogen/starch synthase [Spirochaeta africana]
MSDPLRVLMVSSEAHPIVKVGGLADAVSALAIQLQQQGVDIRILLPNYRECEFTTEGHTRIDDIVLGGNRYRAQILHSRIGTIPVFLLDIPELYDRSGIYGPRIDAAFEDNLQRFGALCAAAPGICRALDWLPEIVHGHDWQSGLLPQMFAAPHLPKHILTIHNIGYQGDFPLAQLPHTGFSRAFARKHGYLHAHKLNLLAGGIVSADAVTTVSRTYAREIQHHHGFGLEHLVRAHASQVTGITNGMDYQEWNPADDIYLHVGFDIDRMAGKGICKRELQMEFGLEPDPQIPVLGMVSRLVDQKGIVELADPEHGILGRLCRENQLQLVVLGSGEAWCEQELQRQARRCPQFGVHIGFDTAMSHRIAAGADFFLMPSRYEPCGLSQLYAMRYGAVPVATNTGGIADTVIDGRTGILFPKASPRHIYRAIERAVALYVREPDTYAAMQREAMQQRFDWGAAAAEYRQLYHQLQQPDSLRRTRS